MKSQSDCFVYFAAAVVNFFSLAAGWGYAWSSPAIPKLNGAINPLNNPLGRPTTLFEDSWITAFLHLGSSFGPLVAGRMADRFGRKRTLLIFAVPMMMSNIMTMFATTVYEFYVARFLIGTGCGCLFTVIPLYTAEISQVHNRGTLSLFVGLNITFSGIICYCFGPMIDIRTMGYIGLTPLILFLTIFGYFIPESPYYYLLINDVKSAETSLQKLRRKSKSSVQKELIDMSMKIKENSASTSTFLDLYKQKNARKAVILVLCIMFFQQTSGICGIMAYLQVFFDATGSTIPSDISAMIVGVTQFLSIVVTSILVDKLGRKILLLISSASCLVSLSSLGVYFLLKDQQVDTSSLFWLPVSCVVLYIVGFSLGLGPLPWTIMSEILPSNVKFYGSSVCAWFVLFLSFIVTMVFPTVSEVLGMSLTMFIFAGSCMLLLIFVIKYLPETMGKSLEEIQRILAGDDKFQNA